MCEYGYGSVCITQGLPSGCRAVTYPTLLHHVKSLRRMLYNVPKLNKSVRMKEEIFKQMIRELIQLGPDLLRVAATIFMLQQIPTQVLQARIHAYNLLVN